MGREEGWEGRKDRKGGKIGREEGQKGIEEGWEERKDGKKGRMGRKDGKKGRMERRKEG